MAKKVPQKSNTAKQTAPAAGPRRPHRWKLAERIGEYLPGPHHHMHDPSDASIKAFQSGDADGLGQSGIQVVRPGETFVTSQDMSKVDPVRFIDLGEVGEEEEAPPVAAAVEADKDEPEEDLSTGKEPPKPAAVNADEAQNVTAKYTKAKAAGRRVWRIKDDYYVMPKTGDVPEGGPMKKEDVNMFLQTAAETAAR